MIATLERKPLGQLLIDKGLIKAEQLERALEEQRRSNHQKLLGEVVAATVRDIRATLQASLPNESVFVIDDIIEDVNPEEFSVIDHVVQDITNIEQMAGDSPVIKLVNYCIYTAVKDGASDIHIEPGDNLLRVRYRIDGRLVEKLRPPFQMHAAVTSRVKIMAGGGILGGPGAPGG